MKGTTIRRVIFGVIMVALGVVGLAYCWPLRLLRC
jgi:hypothetical protein